MRRLIIDGTVLVADRLSGIGHYLQGIVTELDRKLASGEVTDVDASIVVSFDRAARLRPFGLRHIRVRRNPIPSKVMLTLTHEQRLPQMDRLFGRGIYFSPYFHTWPLRQSRAITTIHDLSFEEVPEYADDYNARFLRRAVKDTVARADVIACDSRTMADKVAEFYGVDRERIVLTHPAADAAHFHRRPEHEVVEVLRRYGLAGRYFLSVGNIEPRKNQLSLIRAYLDLPQDVRDEYGLVLLGSTGWKNGHITRLVEEARRRGADIALLEGKVTDDDLPAVYSGAAALVFPSLYEGFGIPIVEAMMCGTPVVLSNVSVMPEVGGDAPLYVDPRSVSDIGGALVAITRLTAGEREAMVERGFAQAARYSWSDTVDTLLTACRAIA